jgi:hypothetical protein
MGLSESAALCEPSEALYAALRARYGLVVRGGREALSREKARLAREDPALNDLTLLGPDENGQIWLVRKDRLGGNGR